MDFTPPHITPSVIKLYAAILFITESHIYGRRPKTVSPSLTMSPGARAFNGETSGTVFSTF